MAQPFGYESLSTLFSCENWFRDRHGSWVQPWPSVRDEEIRSCARKRGDLTLPECNEPQC
jgi:hypothetical protein